jgi:hypothetical protein
MVCTTFAECWQVCLIGFIGAIWSAYQEARHQLNKKKLGLKLP